MKLKHTKKTQKFTLEESLAFRIVAIANYISKPFAEVGADEFDITLSEWRIILFVFHNPGTSANELCVQTGMRKMNVSHMIGRLETTGKLTRSIDKNDRRKRALNLTEDGLNIYKARIPIAIENEKLFSMQFSPREIKQLRSQLDTLLGFVQTQQEN